MDTIPNDLAGAALAARERLAGLARRAADMNTEPGGGPSEEAMAAAARTAVFADALENAMHARLEELKNVTR